MREITVIDLGDEVVCDGCNADLTRSKLSGGFTVGSYAYCPLCCSQVEDNLRRRRELHFIEKRCPEGMPFSDWVRKELRGGKDGKISIEFWGKKT